MNDKRLRIILWGAFVIYALLILYLVYLAWTWAYEPVSPALHLFLGVI